MANGNGARRRASRRGSAWWRIAPVPVAAVVVWTAMTVPGAAQGSSVAADWRMDEAAGASVLVDHGPFGLDGDIGTSILAGVLEQGAVAHRFSEVDPDDSPVDPQRLDVVADDDHLDPGVDPFAVSVRLRTTSPQGNVVQKGQATTPGGYFKLDMDDGRIACLFKGAEGNGYVRSAQGIADGAWHEVRCVRRTDEVVLAIDGVVVDRSRNRTGAISNDRPITIAGKGSCNQQTVGCDYFSGDLDRVLLERSTELTTTPAPQPTTTTAAPTTIAAPTSAAPTTIAAPTSTTVRPAATATTTTTTVVK